MTTTAGDGARAREFDDQGFTVARGFFSKEETAGILADVQHCIGQDTVPTALTDSGIVYTGGIFMRCEQTRALLASQRLIDLLRPIAGDDLWVSMDQAVTKHPGAGVFRWHQDNGYNHLKVQHYQVWVALTETCKQNGALTLAPGSHKRGLLPHKFAGGGQMEVQAEVGDTVCIDATAGDVIVFSSLMLHCTGPNEADRARVAYVAEYLPLGDFAFGAKPPYFVAATDGRSDPHFVQTQPGAWRLKNQLLYLGPRLRQTVRRVLHPVRHALRARR
jgi:hypothetical protein